MILPNFIICGAAKAGTTALYKFLREHPDVYMPERKEPQFFYNHNSYRRGIKSFSKSYFDNWNGQKGIGTTCTEYLWRAVVPERIKQHLPNVKLIFLLRNPIDRIYSHYNFCVRKGYKNPLEEFSCEIRRKGSTFNTEMIYRGMYHVHIKRYERYFSRDQIKVVLYKNFKKKPKKTIKNIYNFIGVSNKFIPNVSKKYNVSTYPKNYTLFKFTVGGLFYARKALRNKFFTKTEGLARKVREYFYEKGATRTPPKMDPADRAYLYEIYREPNARLAEYLGRDLSHWT